MKREISLSKNRNITLYIINNNYCALKANPGIFVVNNEGNKWNYFKLSRYIPFILFCRI